MKEDECPLMSMMLMELNAATKYIENKLLITCKKMRP